MPARGRTMARIDPHAVAAMLSGSPLARQIEFFAETPSTNMEAKALARNGAPGGTLVYAERQTAGRGRRGRSWESEDGTAICMSLLLRPKMAAELAPRITMAAALGVCRALCAFGAEAVIKWPNDVLAGGKKLCGILSEVGMAGDALSYIVCGIGINVGQRAFSGELTQTASSLLLQTGCLPTREAVLLAVVRELAPLFPACESDAGFDALMQQYRRFSCTLGQGVTITGADGTLSGVAEDFDALGRILLRTDGGERLTIHAGDVSLRTL